MFRRIVRSAVPVVALVAAGAALTACNPNDTSSAGSPSTSAAADSDASGQGNQAGTPSNGSEKSDTKNTDESGSGSGSGKPSTVECLTGQLKTTVQHLDSGAGHLHSRLVFQNTGSQTCALNGYPGVSFVKEHNLQMGKAATRTRNAPVATVKLAPDARAYADVQTVNGQGGYSAAQCGMTSVPTLRVYPPNQTKSTNVAWNKEECVGSGVQNLQVGPVHAAK